MPALIAPSPIIEITELFSPLRSLATAIPRPAEIDVDECPAPNGSNSDSSLLVKPDRPSFCLRVFIRALLPVSIL